MVGRTIKGENDCFACGKTINWETIPESAPGMAVVYEQPKNIATDCAVGKNDVGEVVFEISCKCPICRTKNKFIVSRKI